ncbi:2og-fe oxygenase family protein [Colletotrichum kahawae]|uniref:2og-fe oxygenase family protein n=1 Tax=Colletotrichum kahawae TaxID=34407 RepID=A0AAE0D3W6_COLKA|nr:2og-fe oxygenase family protein [Colletotrichum kahawae]
MKKNLSASFSTKALAQQESIVHSVVDGFIDRLESNGTSRKGLDMTKWFEMVAFDILGEMAFGESFHCIETGKSHFWSDMIVEHLFFVTVLDNLRRYPILDALGRRLLPRLTVSVRDRHSGYSRTKVERRLQGESGRQDFLTNVSEKVKSGEVSQEEMTAHASTLVIAGGETVATFLAAVTFFLLKNPATYLKLQHEIRSNYSSLSEITAMSAQQLPYLQAVISEGLRMYPPGSQGFPRTCPGASIDGHWVPKGGKIPKPALVNAIVIAFLIVYTASMSAQIPLTEKVAKEDADLRVVSLQKLMDGDASVKEDLLKACTDLGFFYLDCRNVASGRIMKEVQDMYTLATSFYDLAQEEKSRWLVDRDHDEHLVMGYKPAGHGNGPVEGKKDGFEGLMLFEHPISKIDDPSSFPGPEVISNELDPLKQAMSSFREMSILLLTRISEALGLKDNLAYQQYHRKNAVCPTALGLLKYTLAEVENDKVGQIAHSDAGSLSIVFTEVAGLQVLKPNEETWYYIAPKPGHAVVNVGDALRFISGGVLESSLHRIIPHKDEMGRHKYSIVYLLRPEMDAEFVDAEGIVWKGLDWTNKKHAVFRASAEEQAQGTYLTGRDGYVGHWDPEKDAESQTITVR